MQLFLLSLSERREEGRRGREGQRQLQSSLLKVSPFEFVYDSTFGEKEADRDRDSEREKEIGAGGGRERRERWGESTSV